MFYKFSDLKNVAFLSSVVRFLVEASKLCMTLRLSTSRAIPWSRR